MYIYILEYLYTYIYIHNIHTYITYIHTYKLIKVTWTGPLPPVRLSANDGRLVPLIQASFDTIIFDSMSSTAMSLEFCNSYDVLFENVILTQPIDPKAAIYSVCITIGDKVIEADVMEKQEATRVYERATREGHGAYLAHRDENQGWFVWLVITKPFLIHISHKCIYIHRFMHT